MPTGSAIVSTLKNIKEIPEADRIVQAEIYGETVIVSKEYEEGQLGLLFDIETQLSHEFAHHNNLYRHSELNEDKTASGYFEDNRRVRPIRLKGIRTSGFWIPINSLDFVYEQESCGGTLDLKEGTQLTEVNGVQICEKYKVPSKTQGSGKKSKEGRVSMKDLVPTFKEHFDTDHWARNKQKVSDSDLVIITEKLHGTSVRCGRLPVKKSHGKLLTWLFKLLKIKVSEEYKFVVGSRRTVKSIDGNEREEAKHYYDSDLWTDICSRHLKEKLEKGESVYGEIVGYTPQGSPIMGTHSNEKLKPFMSKEEYKEFIDRYGKHTRFHYGCYQEYLDEEGNTKTDKANKLFVYRITRTNEDGETIDLSWEQVKRRCEKLGVGHVPELNKSFIKGGSPSTDTLDTLVSHYTESPSEHFPQHLNEGVCIRVENGSLTPLVLKNKNYYFRVLEGQITEPSLEDEN